MIVRNFNVIRIAILPLETDAPLFVDTDSMLTFMISGKGVKCISRVKQQSLDAGSGMYNHETFSILPFERLETAYPLVIR